MDQMCCCYRLLVGQNCQKNANGVLLTCSKPYIHGCSPLRTHMAAPTPVVDGGTGRRTTKLAFSVVEEGRLLDAIALFEKGSLARQLPGRRATSLDCGGPARRLLALITQSWEGQQRPHTI